MTHPQQIGVATVLGGDFRLIKPLGAGGMGVVYLAEQLSTEKRRAVKVMRSTLVDDDKQRRRFVREAKATASIDSAHVVEVISAGVSEGGVPWLAMELMQGQDLSAFLKDVNRLSLAQLLTLFEQMCHALDAAHRAGIVHRDIKPENVFLAHTRQVGGELIVKVLDFGIAKMVDAAKTGGTAALGSPMWMAPEQTNPDVPISPATDVWALGLIAYWALTGHSYWKSAKGGSYNIHEMLREVLFDPLLAPSRRCAEGDGDVSWLPAGFDDWFERCVHREPRARFASAADAYAALSKLGEGRREPLVSTHPYSDGDAPDDSAAPAVDKEGLSTGDFLAQLDFGTNHVLRDYRSSPPAQSPAARQDVAAEAVAALAPVASQGETMNDVLEARVSNRHKRRRWVLPTVAGAALLMVVVGGLWFNTAEVRTPTSSVRPPEASADVHIIATVEPPAPMPPVTALPTGTPTLVPIPTATATVRPPVPPRHVPTPRHPPPRPPTTATATASQATTTDVFNRAYAERAVQRQSSVANSMCKGRDGPKAIAGTVLFAPSGQVKSVNLSRRERTSSGGFCVQAAMRGIVVPAFSGPPQAVGFGVVLD